MNLSLFKRQKDQCDTCFGFQTNNISEEYSAQIERKEAARAEKVNDKQRLEDSSNLKVVTLDLQAVLLCPLLKASALYYKTKLACHNFTIHDMKNRDVICYFWDETQGDLSANSFASCLFDYIESLDNSIKEIIIHSDSCTYQNRNVTLCNAFVKNIIQKILEKGHTQMECDSVHCTIEHKIGNKLVHSPQGYVDFIKSARSGQPYTVKYLTYEFFKNFGD